MDPISLPVIHPGLEKMKRSVGMWHILAGILILTHALTHIHSQESRPVYFWCQLIISLDIIVLVLVGRDMLNQMPQVNIFFRVVEIVFFLGIGLIMLSAGRLVIGIAHIVLSIAYCWLLYCEKGIREPVLLSFHHIGVSVPGVPGRRFLSWTHINDVYVDYDSIRISTSQDKEYRFEWQKNLEFGELGQIHDFCSHYLGALWNDRDRYS